MKATILLLAVILLASAVFAKGPKEAKGEGRPDIATIIASLSTDEQTYVTCMSDFLVSSVTFDATVAQAVALSYLHYYQENSSLVPTDTSSCGTTVPVHVVAEVSP